MTKTETRYYINCPNCEGPQQVYQYCGYVRSFPDRGPFHGQPGYMASCRGCNKYVLTVGKPRRVDIPTRDSQRGIRPCNGVCINGKTSCDCKCRGRCHGAGACYCGTQVAA